MKIIPILLALGLGVGGVLAPSVPAVSQEGTVTITAAPTAFGVLRPGQPMLVTGTVRNDTGRSVDVGTATVHIPDSKMVTRSALARWFSTDHADEETGAPALGEARIGELVAGQVRTFSITVPAASLAFMGGPTGVYPLEVRLATDQLRVASQRSTVSWVPDGQSPQASVAIVTPLTTPAPTAGLMDATTLETLTAPGGALDEQLTTALSHTVAVGVDPRIIASIRLLGELAPSSALDWLQRLERAPNDIFALGYADADQLLLHQAGVAEPLAPTSFPVPDEGTPAPETSATPGSAPAGDPGNPNQVAGSPVAMRTTIDGLAWPARALTSEKDLDFLAAGGASRSLLLSTEVNGSVLSTPNLLVGEHRVVVADDRVSTALGMATGARTESEWVSAAATLTAELTVIAAQSPDAVIVATVSRASAANSRLVTNTLAAVNALSSIRQITLSGALNTPPVTGTIPESELTDAAKERIPLTKELLASEAALTSFSTVVDDPTLVTGPQRLDLLALTSAAWASDFPAWAEAARAQLALNASTLAAVHLPESSSITFLQEKGNLPITVRNELDFPVTVYVTVRPERAILTVSDSWVKLNIEPNSQAKASIPVESIANGEVRTTVSLTSSTGVSISQPSVIVLNVQAGWETTATVVLAIIVVVLFGAGVLRTVKRSRSARAAASETASETKADTKATAQPSSKTKPAASDPTHQESP